MSSNTGSYYNPRVDGIAKDIAAVNGRVVLDAAKVLWVGSMLGFGVIGSALTFTWGAFALFVVTTLVTLCFGHSLGMHRLFIHRSYACPKWLEYLFVHLGVLVGLAGPFGMLVTHDTRDWAQRQPRCHDYFAHNEVWYRDFYWQVFCSIKLRTPLNFKIEPELAKDRVYVWMEKTWMLQQLPWAVLFYGVGGWAWVFWGVCTRVSVGIAGHWLVGFFAHNYGARDWHVKGAAVQGHNVRWCALLTMGESWHNNHHAFPGSARLGIEPGQWDPGWWALSGLRRLGLVTNVVTFESLEKRTDLEPTNG